jgi:hypothetical protein
MLLKNDFITVEVGGLTIRSHNIGAPQFVLNPDAISGWYDGASVKRTAAVRPNVWGDFSQPGLRNARLIQLVGTAVATTPFELHQMRDRFTSVLAHGGYEMMSLQNKSGTRYADVALEGTPAWIQQTDTAASWKLDLYAPDPRIYGEIKTLQINEYTTSTQGGLKHPLKFPLNFYTPIESQSQEVVNHGNVDSWPIFNVQGDFPQGFIITDNLNSRVVFNGTVTQFAPVIIDMRAGTAIQSGVDKSSLMSVRQWFSIPAGQALAPAFEPIQSGVGWCDIIYRDTWI